MMLTFEEQIALIQTQLWTGDLECNWKESDAFWMPIGDTKEPHQFNFNELEYRTRENNDEK
tara:strand:- start:521 stop:703 length:183 start_codon:yes stop_codon:yes gene_type:complete